MSGDAEALAARKQSIERELRERLDRDRSPAPLATAPAPLPGVALVCLECRGMNSGDARFCTQCGSRFNALVVMSGSRPTQQGGV